MIALNNPYFFSSRVWRRVSTAAALAVVLVFAGCKSNSATTPTNTAATDPNGPDPALANLDGQTGAVLGQSDAYQPQQQGETPQQQGAPAPGAPVADEYNATDYSYDQNDANSEPVATTDQAPPPLPEYDQPPAPDPNYLWTPGYWAWGDDGYYWVPGEWVPPPYYGALWTPPYWGWCSYHYCFHRGYWGPHVGFYGGIDYGFGYIGFGYFGGYWRGHDFYYNRSVTNVGPGVRNFYERNVVVNNVHYGARPSNRVSFNGGHGGVNVQPRPAEVAAMRESHERPVAAQVATRQQAMRNPQSGFNQNHGKPQTVAFSRPAGTSPRIAEAPANRGGAAYNRPIEPNAGNRPGAPGNRPGEPTNRPGQPNRPGAPNNMQPQRNVPQQQRPTPQQQQRPPQENRAAPQPTHQPPQQHNESHMTPPQRVNPAPRPQPMQQQRSAPAPRPQPERAAPAPRAMPQPQRAAPAPRPAPAPRAAAPAPRAAAPAPHPAEAPHPAPAHEEHPH